MLRWLRRNDPLGATVKGAISVIFGVIFWVSGGAWLGVTFVVLGVAALAMPIVWYRRDRERERRWQSRRMR